jgi:hypothetical protein
MFAFSHFWFGGEMVAGKNVSAKINQNINQGIYQRGCEVLSFTGFWNKKKK